MKSWLFTIALAALLAAPPAVAFPTSRLIYERGSGAEHCPEEAIVRGRVADRLGYDPFVDDAARTLVARVFRLGERLEADVQLVDQLGQRQGSRRLSTEVERCDELISALALTISIAIDPERVQTEEDLGSQSEAAAPASDRRESKPEPAASVGEPKAAVQWDTGVEDEREQRRPPTLRWHSGAGGLAAIGVAPAPTGGAFVFVGAELGQAWLSLEGRADAPASTGAAGGEASSSLLLASVIPCWQPSALFACAVGSIGAVRGRGGDRITQPRSDSGFYAAAGVRLGSDVPLHEPLSLRLHVDVLSTLTRFTLEVDERPIWKAPPFSSAAGLALLAHFP